LNHGQSLGDGFEEYSFDGYRVISITDFHFLKTDMRRRQTQLQSVLGDANQPYWIVYLGFGVPDNKLEILYRRLPPGQLLKRHSLHGNELLQVQLATVSREKQVQRSNERAAIQ
jgi:hypothetical protein